MAQTSNYCLTIKDALKIVINELNGKGSRSDLINKIGPDMYNKLCTLGYITQGVSYNTETRTRIRVWKLTKKPNLFAEIEREPNSDERLVGKALTKITF